MKVYVVRWIDSELYSGYSGIHKIFYSKSDAQEYVDEHGGSKIDEDIVVSHNIEEHEVT